MRVQCEVVGKLYSAMESIARKERGPRELGAPVPLHRADVQFIDAVALNPGENATALAQALGVTRGAVTQWGNRLEKLGLIRRVPVQGNRKEKRLLLTGLGEQVRARRDQAHHNANARMCAFLGSLQDAQIEAIMLFLHKAASLDISPFECMACCAAKEQGGGHA